MKLRYEAIEAITLRRNNDPPTRASCPEIESALDALLLDFLSDTQTLNDIRVGVSERVCDEAAERLMARRRLKIVIPFDASRSAS